MLPVRCKTEFQITILSGLDECCDYFTKQETLHHHAFLYKTILISLPFPRKVHSLFPQTRLLTSVWAMCYSLLLNLTLLICLYTLFHSCQVTGGSCWQRADRRWTEIWTEVGITCKVLSFMWKEKCTCLSRNLPCNFKNRETWEKPICLEENQSEWAPQIFRQR